MICLLCDRVDSHTHDDGNAGKTLTQHTETDTPKRYDFYDFNDIMIGSAMCDFRYIREDDHDRIVAALQTQVDAQIVNIRALTKHGDTLRTQLAQEYARGLVDGHNSMCKTADAELAQAQNEALRKAIAACECLGVHGCDGYPDRDDCVKAIRLLLSPNSAEGEP